MKKRILSLSLVVAMILSTVAFATETDETTEVEAVKTATISVDVSAADLGYILDPIEVEFTDEETVFDLLTRTLDQEGISYTAVESERGTYISEIGGISEYDHGSWSGWMFQVNGEFPIVGMSAQVVEQDDVIVVEYSIWYDEETEEQDELEPDFIEIDGVTVDANKIAEFSDSENISSWAETSINIASALSFVNGSNDGNFYPQNSITRAEFAKMIVEVMGLEDDETQVDEMTDVADTQWYANYVKVAQQHGLMNGAYNLFRPTDSITREEIATVLCRAFGIETLESDETIINDIDEASSYAVDYIYAVSSNAIMTGSNNEFSPKDNATREMVAVVLIRSYKTYILEIETEVEEEVLEDETDVETDEETEVESEDEIEEETEEETEDETEEELEDEAESTEVE